MSNVIGKLIICCQNIRKYVIDKHGEDRVSELIGHYVKPSKKVGLALYGDDDMQDYIAKKYTRQFVDDCLQLAVTEIDPEDDPVKLTVRGQKTKRKSAGKYRNH